MAEEIEKLKAEVFQVCAALELMHANTALDYGTQFGGKGFNYSLEACEIAAKMLGVPSTYAKMLNRQFRDDACALMFERACADVGRPLAA